MNEKCNFPRKEYRALRVLFRNWDQVGFEHAGTEYAKHNHSRASKLFDEKGLISEARLKRHIRGRLEYYTMISGSNKKVSQPLAKLWDMYHDVTGEKVPISAPERTVIQTEVCYSWKNDQGETVLFCEDGSSFLTDWGLLFTCAHCLCDLSQDHEKTGNELCTFAIPRIVYEPKISEFVIDKAMDIAVIKAPPFMKNASSVRINKDYLPQIGESIMAYGFAGGNSLVRCIEAKVAEMLTGGKIRVDRAFIHGMSGSPVVNR